MKPIKGIGEEKVHINKQCPVCSSINSAKAIVCVNCNTDLSCVTAQPDSSQVATPTNHKYKKQPDVSLPKNVPINKMMYNILDNKYSKIMEETSDAIVHFSVDDPENIEEEHIKSVEQSANDLAIDQ